MGRDCGGCRSGDLGDARREEGGGCVFVTSPLSVAPFSPRPSCPSFFSFLICSLSFPIPPPPAAWTVARTPPNLQHVRPAPRPPRPDRSNTITPTPQIHRPPPSKIIFLLPLGLGSLLDFLTPMSSLFHVSEPRDCSRDFGQRT